MHTWAILLALAIIVGSHIHMLMSDKDPSKRTHAYVMLATAGLIAYGAFTR
jgi:hypothetical protein